LLDEDSLLSEVTASLSFDKGNKGGGTGISLGLNTGDGSGFAEPPPPPPLVTPAVLSAHDSLMISGDAPPVRIGGQLEPAAIKKQTLPIYPDLAVRTHIEGAVVLDATIGEDGKLHDITVVSGHPLLVPAALDCVKQWRYRPAVLNGHIIPSPATIRVQFRIAATRYN
jgi:protein TonB